jgi:hypothetical protein
MQKAGVTEEGAMLAMSLGGPGFVSINAKIMPV